MSVVLTNKKYAVISYFVFIHFTAICIHKIISSEFNPYLECLDSKNRLNPEDNGKK